MCAVIPPAQCVTTQLDAPLEKKNISLWLLACARIQFHWNNVGIAGIFYFKMNRYLNWKVRNRMTFTSFCESNILNLMEYKFLNYLIFNLLRCEFSSLHRWYLRPNAILFYGNHCSNTKLRHQRIYLLNTTQLNYSLVGVCYFNVISMYIPCLPTLTSLYTRETYTSKIILIWYVPLFWGSLVVQLLKNMACAYYLTNLHLVETHPSLFHRVNYLLSVCEKFKG